MADPQKPQASGRYNRSLKNYLLDVHFQLKYTSYLVGVAVVLSLALGGLLWSASREVIAQSQKLVAQGQEIVARGQEVVRESQKVSAVVKMNIVREYGGNPELAAVFEEGSRAQDRRLDDQQAKLKSDAIALAKRAEDLLTEQRRTFAILVVALSLLVLGVGIVGIMVTHRIAGPIFKMKRLLGNVGEGKLTLREKLRKGDELQHFFDAFEKMVTSLRARQGHEIAELDAAIAVLEAHGAAADLEALRALRRDMQAALDA